MNSVLIATFFLQLLLIGQGQDVLQCPILRVFFEIDASISIQQQDFNNEITVVRSLINSLRHSVGTSVGFVPFDADVILPSLNNISMDLDTQISQLGTLGLGSSGMTSFTNALRFANDSVFADTLLASPQNVLVLLTDGIDSNADSSVLTALSSDLRTRKLITIIVVGFGSIPNTNQLVTITSMAERVLLFSDSAAVANNFQQIFSNTSICITVQLQPPTGLNAINIESTRMTIQWIASTSPVTSYRVCYSTSTNDNNICDNMVTAPITATSQVISGLSPFTLYRYAVFSVNNNALLRSNIQSATTAQQGSSVPVQNLASQVVNFNTATLTWQAPVQQGRNGIITNYEVCYVPSGIENCQPLQLVGADVFTHTATLMANTQYRARVSPLSNATAQPRGMSASVTFTTPPFPAVLITRAEAISATQIIVEWTSPSFAVNNYILTATNGTNVITVNPTGSNTSFVIGNASPFTDYLVVLQANTNNGLNLPSDSRNVSTFEAPPSGPVINLLAEGFTPTSIRINFTQPPMDTWNGILTQYLICLRDNPQANCERNVRVPYAPTISYIFQGLISDTPYNVSVSPENGAGTGPESVASVTTPAADIPPVLNLRGMQSAARQISLTWTNPPEAADTSIVGGIRVCYGMASIDCQFSVDLPRDQQSVILNITEPINPYYISVSLTTPTGSRGQSDSIFVPISIVEVRSLAASAVSMNEIFASWLAPVVPIQFTLQAYRICVRLVNQSSCVRNFTVAPDQLNVVIEALNPNTQYSVSVSPVIQEDFFIRVQTSSATTFPASPSDAPQLVSVDFALRTALRVSWTPPASPTGTIITYEVVYQGTVVDTRGVRSDNATMNLLYRTIVNLEEAETYQIQVRARYITGPGSLSLTVRGTTLEDAPSNVVTALTASVEGDGVTVSWYPPVLIDRNGVISRYDVTCTSENNAPVVNRVDGQTTQATLFNLPPQTTCNLTVIPYTNEGPGPVSSSLLAPTQVPVNLARFCDDFRIGVSLVTILSAILVVSIIALLALVFVHYWTRHRSPLDPPVEIYATPHQKTVSV